MKVEMNSRSEAVPARDDAARVSEAVRTFGLRAVANEAGVSTGAVTRVAAGAPVKRASLAVVVAAADRMSAARARKLQHSDERGNA